MASLKIEFEKGGVFTARLLEDEAPKTCDTLKSRLPFEYIFQQSIVSGQAMVAIPPDLTVERENQRVAGILPGALSFLVKDEITHVPDEIYIAYGIFISAQPFADSLVEIMEAMTNVGPCTAIREASRGRSPTENMSARKIEQLRSLGYVR